MDPNTNDIELSDKFRKQGNELFVRGEYFGAIAQYNKALVCARKDPGRAALCHGNRSAVYLELEYFEHCLHNIDLAEPNFPAEKIQKLQERRQRCLEMMKTKSDKAMKVFEHDFKLSYPANPKIPFFIDALELKDESERGKHLITTQDLKAGDVIAVMDKPWRNAIWNLDANYVLGCYTCADTNNGDLIPGKCQALFCSQECIDKHDRENFNHEDFIHFDNGFSGNPLRKIFTSLFSVGGKFLTHIVDVFGSVDELRKFVDDHSDKNHTVFDFDWSVDDDETRYKNMLLSMLIDSEPEPCNEGAEDLIFLKTDNKFKKLFDDPKHIEFVNEMSTRLAVHKSFVQTPVNSSENVIAMYTHPALKLLTGHETCDPNVVMHSNRRAIIFTVLHPIKTGGSIASSPQPFYRSIKSLNMSSQCRNQESCMPCKNNWTSQVDASDIHFDYEHNSFNFYMRNDPKKLSTQLKQIKMCAEFINKNFEGFYANATKRRLIATKQLELENILHHIGNPFPISNSFLTWRPSDGEEKYDEWEKITKINSAEKSFENMLGGGGCPVS